MTAGRIRDTAGNFKSPSELIAGSLSGIATEEDLQLAVNNAVSQALDTVATDADLHAALTAALAEALGDVVTSDELALAIAAALDQIEPGDTFITNVTEETTFVTNVTNNIVQTYVNGKKGQANELATLDANSQHTPAQIPPGIFHVIFEGGEQSIEAGLQADVIVPFNCTLTEWTMVATPLDPATTGSIQIDIWKDTYANFPPTDADSITNGSEPAIAGGVKAADAAITDWSGEAVAAGSVLRFNVDSATDIQRCTLALKYQRT